MAAFIKKNKWTLAALVLALVAAGVYMNVAPWVGLVVMVAALGLSYAETARLSQPLQFTVAYVMAVGLGVMLDLRSAAVVPYYSLAMLFSIAALTLRPLLVRHMSYTRFNWLDALLIAFSLTCYLVANLAYPVSWMGWVFPLPGIIWAGGGALGNVFVAKNQRQYLKSGKGPVEVNEEAPDFELEDQQGRRVRLSDYKNDKNVLLFFHRDDWCPVCHMMLRSYNKNIEKFREKNIKVMVIGHSTTRRQRREVEELNLDYEVLSDTTQQTAKKYGVHVNSDTAGSENGSAGFKVIPSSFLIDKQGKVRHVTSPDNVGAFIDPSSMMSTIESLPQG